MNRIVNFIPGFIDRMLPLFVFCTYVYFGNKITMSQIVICDTMIRRFNGKISHIIHKYNDMDNLQQSLIKVYEFLASNENQKGVVVKKETTDSETAVKIKGNFCRGIPQEQEKEEKDESKSYLEQLEAWVSSKFETKEEDDKKDEDKKVE